MEFIRGTTPTIFVLIPENIDMSLITEIWIYIYQNGKLKVDKTINDMYIDYEKHSINVDLTQNDTLELKHGDAKFQIRVVTNGKALATLEYDVYIHEVYKGGVI